MISLTGAMIVEVAEARADSSKTDEDGTRRVGKHMGRFMSSFLEGLDSQESNQKGYKDNSQLSGKSSRNNRLTNSRPGSYDPWRAVPERHSAYSYDPWGATGNSRSLTRFADEDWNTQRHYYGAGLESWYGQDNNSLSQQYNSDYRRWNRGYQHNWRSAPYNDLYGAEEYNRSKLNW
ncbi:MAG: hypothetical protein HQL70_00365 [Magnetococcales bacterium]|nr:hypothetical protein [Magnetococcales bacterium]